MTQRVDISIVIPIFNEAENLQELARRLRETLDATRLVWEVVFVNDGSRDETLRILRDFRERDERIRIIDFSRNFGHQVAVTAGIDRKSTRLNSSHRL